TAGRQLHRRGGQTGGWPDPDPRPRHVSVARRKQGPRHGARPSPPPMSPPPNQNRLASAVAFSAQRLGPPPPAGRSPALAEAITESAIRSGAGPLHAFAQGSTSDETMQTLVRRLTVGETYFFREPRTLDALRTRILPDLIRQRRQGARRLRFWSAGCCTGE